MITHTLCEFKAILTVKSSVFSKKKGVEAEKVMKTSCICEISSSLALIPNVGSDFDLNKSFGRAQLRFRGGNKETDVYTACITL